LNKNDNRRECSIESWQPIATVVEDGKEESCAFADQTDQTLFAQTTLSALSLDVADGLSIQPEPPDGIARR
jgi:hypothetical protein